MFRKYGDLPHEINTQSTEKNRIRRTAQRTRDPEDRRVANMTNRQMKEVLSHL